MTITNPYIQDVTLRDGTHAVRHRISPANVRRTVAALDAAGAGTDAIEVARADGPAGGSLTYGPDRHTTSQRIGAAATAQERGTASGRLSEAETSARRQHDAQLSREDQSTLL